MPTDSQLFDILQKLADSLDALKAEVKALSDKVNGPTAPPQPPNTPPNSWLDVFRKVWKTPLIDEWDASWGPFPWNKDGIITVANPISVGVTSADQKSFIVKLARWGFAPSDPATPTAWNLTDLQKVWNNVNFILKMSEEDWQNSIYAKYNIEPDLVAFLTYVEHFDPTNPWSNFGTDTNRPDKLQDMSLDKVLARDYFNTHQGGGPGQGGGN